MSRLFRFAAAVVLIAASEVVSAASISIAEADTASGKSFALTLTAPVNETFNGFGVRVNPISPATLLNPGPGGFTDVPGVDKTFINAYLEAPWLDGYLSILAPSTTADALSFDAVRLGAYINASGGMFLANIVLPIGGQATYRVILMDTGNEVGVLTGVLGIPEPATLAMAGMGLIGLVLRRRNG